MDARQLRYFLAVVDHGNMTKAAEDLHITQPSLSQAIHGLERELGTQLFHRTGRRLVLSAAGSAAVEPARRVVHGLAEVAAAVRPVRDLSGGRVDLVVQHMLTGASVDVVSDFCQRYPQVAVRMVEPRRWHHVGQLVRGGECELGLCTLPIPDGNGLCCRELAATRFFIALPPGNAFADAEGPLRPRDLAGQRFVTSPPGSAWREALEEVMAETGHRPVAAIEITSHAVVMPLVMAGVGAALIAGNIVESAREQGAIVRPLSTGSSLRIGIVHRSAPLSPAAEVLVALMDERSQRLSKHDEVRA